MTDKDLHGNAPDSAGTALLIVDVINDLEFPGADRLFESALNMARCLIEFKARASRAGIPCVYVNDNFGRWRSSLETLVSHGLESNVRGKPIVKMLRPKEDDYFILKPKHSGFYATPLPILLDHLGAKRLIMTGLTADSCVLFTANDAYVREYELCVPADCVASIDPELNEQSLRHMRSVLRADIALSTELDLGARA
ncbi:MAG: cysteine hydrolase [Gammaproteobacteria bacterium]|nr:cysteine hydrolase [Gammaproteobacteria bacterium]MBA3731304.1 cysteine hydrolase [Gammaproteobacteria bacterium]